MNDNAKVKPLISDSALDLLLRKARSFYDLAKWGPTTANSQPQRILFVRSAAAKERLKPALSGANQKKVMGAPVVAILAYDMRFWFVPFGNNIMAVPVSSLWSHTTKKPD